MLSGQGQIGDKEGQGQMKVQVSEATLETGRLNSMREMVIRDIKIKNLIKIKSHIKIKRRINKALTERRRRDIETDQGHEKGHIQEKERGTVNGKVKIQEIETVKETDQPLRKGCSIKGKVEADQNLLKDQFISIDTEVGQIQRKCQLLLRANTGKGQGLKISLTINMDTENPKGHIPETKVQTDLINLKEKGPDPKKDMHRIGQDLQKDITREDQGHKVLAQMKEQK